MNDVGFVLQLTVHIELVIAQVNAVSRDSDDALYHVQAGLSRGKKYNDVMAVNVPIGNQRTDEGGLRREYHPVHKNVVTDEQRVLHRTGRNLKCLQRERDDEQADNKNHGHRSDELGGGLFRFLFLLCCFL